MNLFCSVFNLHYLCTQTKQNDMKYPIGIQNFEKVRDDGYVYVDKTALISTMAAYFSGKRELFKGLAIEKLEQKWTQYPILHLDLISHRLSAASTDGK